MGGQGEVMTGGRKTTKVGSRVKNKKLPGVSASQKSVKEYFVRKSTIPCVGPSGVCALRVVTDMSARKNVSRPDIEKVPSVMKSNKHTQKGGEGRDSSEMLVEGRGGGVHRQFEDSHIHSPISKKKTFKSKSVAQLRNSSISENNSKLLNQETHAPCSNHSQSWRQKLAVFKPDES